MNEKDVEGLREIVRGSLPGIKQSNAFLSLLSPDYEKDPVPVLQLGLAVLLDKPICILAIRGQKVPQSLRKLAFAVEEVEGDDVEAATKRLMEKYKEVMK
jgi:hypothetical protein